MRNFFTHPRCGHVSDISAKQSSLARVTAIDPESRARVDKSEPIQPVPLLCPRCGKAKIDEINDFYWSLRKRLRTYRDFWLPFWHRNVDADENIRQGIIKVRLASIVQLKQRLLQMRRERKYLFEREMVEVDIAKEKAEHEEKVADMLWEIDCENLWCSEIAEIMTSSDWPSHDEDEEEQQEENPPEEDAEYPYEGEAHRDNGQAADGA